MASVSAETPVAPAGQTSETPTGADRRRGWPTAEWLLLLVLVAGVVLRLLVTRSNLGRIDADEAVGMLMAKHTASGHISAFFWGENYGGTLVLLVEAPFIRIFGFSIMLFRLFNTALAILSALVLWAIAKRVTGRWGAVAATAVFFLFPPGWVLWSEREYVWWVGGTLLSLLVAYCGLRWHETRADRWLWPIGLLTGLVFWTYPLFGCLIAPPVLAVVWLLRRRPVALVKLAILAPVGAAPWIYANVRYHWESLKTQNATTDSVRTQFKKSVTQVLPEAFISRMIHLASTPRGAIGIAIMVVAGAIAIYAVARRQSLIGLSAVAVLLWPIIVTVTRVSISPGTLRYGFVAVAPIALVAGWIVRRSVVGVLLLVLVVATASTVAFWRDTNHFASVPIKDPATKTLTARLVADGRTHVYAAYWASYVISVESNERIMASPTGRVRYLGYQKPADDAPLTTYVFYRGMALDQQAGQWLASHGGGRRLVIGDYVVYEFDSKIHPQELQLQGDS